MMLLDPREALADQNSFIGYLLGVAGLADTVRTLAADESRRNHAAEDVDDFVYALLGIASLGERINALVEISSYPEHPTYAEPPLPRRWLR